MQVAPSNSNGLRKPRLLVGEKNHVLRGFLKSVFSAEGYEVIEAASGADLLDALTISLHPEFGSGAFALVLSDTSFLREVELESWSRLGEWAPLPPFIFIAGLGDKVPAKLEPFETVAVFGQPLDIANLRDRVNSFLRHGQEETPSLRSPAYH